MVAVGEIFLSAFLQVLFQKLASREMLKFFHREKIHTKVMNWTRTLLKIRAVLDDAEEKQITNKFVNLWLEELQDLAYDLDDLLDEFSTKALLYNLSEKSQFITSKIKTCMGLNPAEANLVHDITIKLQDMSKQIGTLGLHVVNISRTPIQDRERLPTTSATYERRIYGRDSSKTEIINLLLMEEPDVGIIPITGMGGIGKTTLAQVVYNDKAVKRHFDLKAWICVSDNFDIMRITKEIAGYAHVDSNGSKTLDQVQDQLKNALDRKTFLIVLDDVWEIDYHHWNILKIPFSDGAPGCKVIVTTRHTKVASMMGTIQYHALECLPHDECWSIFEQHAFQNISPNRNPNLESIGHEIVKKCGGLPLAARTLGGLLQCKPKKSEWENVLNSEIWDLKGSDILPALRLSYHYLPPHLKQCFAYCAILPKDYEFEEEELVLLWMAEGFICQQEGKTKMEDLGGEYFHELLSRSFFQPSRMMEGSKFVMHDLINDLAQFVASQTCFRFEDNIMKNQEQYEKLKKARHLSYTQGYLDRSKKFENFEEARHLRTFLPFPLAKFPSKNLTSDVPLELLSKLKCLRVLSFSRHRIHEIPESIGDLTRLRYLNLSYTLVERLPNSLGDLYNLQTLLLRECKGLKKFPTSIENLINLRHLDITDANSLEDMPLGIDKLESLKLSNFIITKGNGLRIKELGNFTNLGRKLEIRGLQNVSDPQDAGRVDLNGKKSLDVLSMVWCEGSTNLPNEGVKTDLPNKEVETDVLNLLRPHSNLKELHISFYHGSRFPTWIEDQCFSNMVCISLRDCKNCSSLPQLGQLRLLKKLLIEGISNVEKVGSEFYGQGCSKPFPVLEILSFENMTGWEYWYPYVGEIEVRAFPHLFELSIKRCPKLVSLFEEEEEEERQQQQQMEGPSFMMRLEFLKLQHCEKLEKLPRWLHTLPFLGELEINSCPSLVSFPEKGLPSTLRKLEISECGALEFLPEWMLNANYNLEVLKVDKCTTLKYIIRGVLPPSLKHIKISNCGMLESLVAVEGMKIICPSLESFNISSCNNLKFLPDALDDNNLKNLRRFLIKGLDSLESIPEGWFSLPTNLREIRILDNEKLDALPHSLQNNSNFPSLEVLDVTSLRPSILKKISFDRFSFLTNLTIRCSIREEEEVLSVFPIDGMSLPTSLIQLTLDGFQYLETLCSREFQKLTSLQELYIWRCHRLVSVPKEGLPPSLQELYINFCDEFTSIPDQGLPQSLLKLSISSCNKFGSFPEQGLPQSLLKLSISSCNKFGSFPEQGLPQSLQRLDISYCPNIRSFPKHGLPPSLTSLYVFKCPILTRGWEKSKGEYWPAIRRIPKVTIDGKSISDT
ncbi:Disease resistance RPP13-like protein [Actinidia chinensis var. chinensis]|uniref:Disease resistance RPP13-like protein n=1 Tax=Actinidia chinensis var. chinensis TaxID=1590841 RepID=A0A2R6QQ38_ACTCC|nr:Disease resistance RPP13-like protein [Actinidia chinensis var. chinensis]